MHTHKRSKYLPSLSTSAEYIVFSLAGDIIFLEVDLKDTANDTIYQRRPNTNGVIYSLVKHVELF